MQIKTNHCMTNKKVKIQTILKEKINLLHTGMPDRVNQWLSNWRILCNCVLPACRWPSTYTTTGCMIWYDNGVSVVWIDTYPSRFFTLHIHFFSLNNAGNYNEHHICNGMEMFKVLEMFKVFQKCKFLIQVTDWILEYFLWNCSQVHAT